MNEIGTMIETASVNVNATEIIEKEIAGMRSQTPTTTGSLLIGIPATSAIRGSLRTIETENIEMCETPEIHEIYGILEMCETHGTFEIHEMCEIRETHEIHETFVIETAGNHGPRDV